VPADRDALAARQSELLHALLRGGDFPAGFDARMASAAALALRRKRAQAVARSLPALAQALGEQFEPLFCEHAAAAPSPAKPGGMADGLRFAHAVPAAMLTDAARTELLLRRAQRPAFLGAARLHDARCLLVVVRLPLAGLRVRALSLPRGVGRPTRPRTE
jgi:hypothetical protein